MLQDNPQLMQLRMLQVMREPVGNTLVVGLPAGSAPLPLRGDRDKSNDDKGAANIE